MLISSRQLFSIIPVVLFSVLLAGCEKSGSTTVEKLEAFEPYAADTFLQQIYDLDVESTASLLKQYPNTKVIDVRGVEAFTKERLPNALCYDQSFAGFADEVGAIDRDTLVLLYGNSADNGGMTVSLAVQTMKDLGFKQIYYLGFGLGIEGWKEAGQPYETGY